MVNATLRGSGPALRPVALLQQLYVGLADALDAAAAALAGTGGMGGRVTEFTGPYDRVAAAALSTGCSLAGAVSQLELLLVTTFDNYDRAEDSATRGVMGLTRSAVDLPGPHAGRPAQAYSPPYPCIDPPPTAVGANGGEPWAWHLLAQTFGAARWPDLDTGRVRTAGSAWGALAAAFGPASTFLGEAAVGLQDLRAPEMPLIEAVLTGLGRRMDQYATQVGALATSCGTIADDTDAATAEIRDKLRQAEIEAGVGVAAGLIAGFLTLPLGGSGGALTDSAMTSVLAGTIGATIAGLCLDFFATVVAVCEGYAVMLPVLQEGALAATGILEARAVRVTFSNLEKAGAVDDDFAASVASTYETSAEKLEQLERDYPGPGLGPHTFRRHVGRTVEQLAARFRGKNKVDFSSTFPDGETAAACINRQLRSRESEIDQWLAGGRRTLCLDGRSGQPVGIVVEPDGTITQTDSYRVVLVRDRTQPYGFRVDSAYPTLERSK